MRGLLGVSFLPTASCRLPTVLNLWNLRNLRTDKAWFSCLLPSAAWFMVEAPGIEPGSKGQRRRNLHA